MRTKSRIISVLKANNLNFSNTGLESFYLSELKLTNEPEFELPTNLRLGHLAEKIVSELIKSSTNFKILHENIQIVENKKTIGEIDFIIQNINTNKIIHIELAYKFYLLDPKISLNLINNWIGPNRKDSLKEKLEKLTTKQFPLLYHNAAKQQLDNLDIDKVSQALCILVSLFIPFEYKGTFSPMYEKAIKGYYLNMATFVSQDNSEKTYYIPSKKEWGINPYDNEIWFDFYVVKEHIKTSINEKQALLCWQKYKNSCSAFFIVWW